MVVGDVAGREKAAWWYTVETVDYRVVCWMVCMLVYTLNGGPLSTASIGVSLVQLALLLYTGADTGQVQSGIAVVPGMGVALSNQREYR